MRKLPHLLAAAALGGLAFAATPALASPLTGGLNIGNAAIPQMDEGLVQKVNGWHCRKRYGWYHGHKRWHRHRKACYDDYDDYSYGYGYPGYGLGVAPFITFGFFDDDDHHGRRHHRFKKRRHHGGDWNW